MRSENRGVEPKTSVPDVMTPLIAEATDLGEAAFALIDASRSDEGAEAALPETTVVRLHLVAASTYRSGLVCLWMPETSLASYGLMRGLLEAWAHLHFIADDEAGGDARCRALRYERGALDEWADVGKKVPEGYLGKTAAQRARDERRGDLDRLWSECGCTGATRTRHDVAPTLRTLAHEPNLEWLPGAWSASSVSTHAYGVEFLLDTRGGQIEVVWALPSQRATWFTLLVTAFAHITSTAATILAQGDERITAFEQSARRLLDAPTLRRIAQGDADG